MRDRALGPLAAALAAFVAAPAAAQMRYGILVPDGSDAGGGAVASVRRRIEERLGPPIALPEGDGVGPCPDGMRPMDVAELAAALDRARRSFYEGAFADAAAAAAAALEDLASGCRPAAPGKDGAVDTGFSRAVHDLGALLLWAADSTGGVSSEVESLLRRTLAVWSVDGPSEVAFPPSVVERYLGLESGEAESASVSVVAPLCRVNVAGRPGPWPVRAAPGTVGIGFECDRAEPMRLTMEVAAGDQATLDLELNPRSWEAYEGNEDLVPVRILGALARIRGLDMLVWLRPEDGGVRADGYIRRDDAVLALRWTGDRADAALDTALGLPAGPADERGWESRDGGMSVVPFIAAPLIVAGGVLVGVGAFDLAGVDDRRALSDRAATQRDRDRLLSEADDLELSGSLIAAAGGLMVLVGAGLWILDAVVNPSPETEAEGVAVFPLLGPAAVGASLSVSWGGM